MRRSLYRHVVAAALALFAAGSAFAQSITEQGARSDGALPDAIELAPAAPAAKPLTGTDLLNVPLAAGLEGPDAQVAERLRDLVATKLGRSIERKQDRPAVEAFYRDRGFAPLWVANGAASGKAKTVTAYLRGVEAEGLDPSDYPAPAFANTADDKLAQDELALTDTILTYARHARTGRVSFSRVSTVSSPRPSEDCERASRERSRTSRP